MPNRRGFRPPKVEPTTPWGRHLVAFRRAEDWSQSYAFEQWAEGLGKGARSRTAYRQIEEGRRDPNPHEAAYLISQVGQPPADEVVSEPPPSELSELAASIRLLAETIAQDRAERLEWERGVVESIRAVALALGQRDGPAPEPRASAQQ